MSLFLERFPTEVLCFVALALCTLYWYISKDYGYWKKRKVPCKKSEFPFGSTKDIALAKTFHGMVHENIYKEFPDERYYGIIEFRKPALVVKDPELIKRILVKDFQCFVDRQSFITNPKEYILKHLITLQGQEWKEMRTKLTPTFTSGKIKLMFELVEKCSERMKEQIESQIQNENTIDVKDILGRFTLEIIASCAFGIEINSINEKTTEFFRIFRGVHKINFLEYFRRIFLIFFPGLFSLFCIKLVKPETRDFVTNLIKDTIQYRQKNNIKRNDFVDLLISVKNSRRSGQENAHLDCEKHTVSSEGLTINQMAAQTFVFFLAGYETSSSLMSFCLYELARHHTIQERLYKDVSEAVEKNGGELSYQLLSEIPYLDQVINGMRFAQVQVKMGLMTVLLNFQVDLSSDQEVPIEIEKKTHFVRPAKPVLLKLTKRKPYLI